MQPSPTGSGLGFWSPQGIAPYFGGVTADTMLIEDANTTFHVVWTGAGISDTKGTIWKMNGTVPQVFAGSGIFAMPKPGAGTYSAANNYQSPNNTLGEWAGDWSLTLVFSMSSVSAQVLMGKRSAAGTDGWMVYINATTAVIYAYDGVLRSAAAPGSVPTNSRSVVTVGRSGNLLYCRLNGGASNNVGPFGIMTPATAEPLRIGKFGGGAEATTSTIYEIIGSTTPYTDALHAARWARVSGW